MNKNVSFRKTYRDLIRISLISLFWFELKRGVSSADKLPVFLGQGQICGEVSQTSAILQSRLAPTVTLDSIGNLLGASGIGRFELATNPNFTNSFYTKWIHATPDYDYIIKTKVIVYIKYEYLNLAHIKSIHIDLRFHKSTLAIYKNLYIDNSIHSIITYIIIWYHYIILLINCLHTYLETTKTNFFGKYCCIRPHKLHSDITQLYLCVILPNKCKTI